jgi:hypothetical protein
MMRIWISAFAFVAFVIKYVLWQNFVSAQAQASLGFWILCVQVKRMLLNVGGGVKLGHGPTWAKQGQNILVPVLSENEAVVPAGFVNPPMSPIL